VRRMRRRLRLQGGKIKKSVHYLNERPPCSLGFSARDLRNALKEKQLAFRKHKREIFRSTRHCIISKIAVALNDPSITNLYEG
jgi:hypothetical protein